MIANRCPNASCERKKSAGPAASDIGADTNPGSMVTDLVFTDAADSVSFS
jgi:hypothetical protein